MGPMSPLTRAPSFLSGGLPRDRRGRIAQKQKGKGLAHLVGLGSGEDEDMLGDETPRGGSSSYVVEVEREREREFLEALRCVFLGHFFTSQGVFLKFSLLFLFRSPDVESTAARASVGGWGLGAGHEDVGKAAEEEEEDEPLDWDQAQVCHAIVRHGNSDGLFVDIDRPS